MTDDATQDLADRFARREELRQGVVDRLVAEVSASDRDALNDNEMTRAEASARMSEAATWWARRTGDMVRPLASVLSLHRYDTSTRGSKPDDPGWHPCGCGAWEGYWCDYHEHVAESQAAMLSAGGFGRRRVINPAELDALPNGAVVLTAAGKAQQKAGPTYDGDQFVWRSMHGGRHTNKQVLDRGPVTVLFDPAVDR